jgi:hypothetical protein
MLARLESKAKKRASLGVSAGAGGGLRACAACGAGASLRRDDDGALVCSACGVVAEREQLEVTAADDEDAAVVKDGQGRFLRVKRGRLDAEQLIAKKLKATEVSDATRQVKLALPGQAAAGERAAGAGESEAERRARRRSRPGDQRVSSVAALASRVVVRGGAVEAVIVERIEVPTARTNYTGAAAPFAPRAGALSSVATEEAVMSALAGLFDSLVVSWLRALAPPAARLPGPGLGEAEGLGAAFRACAAALYSRYIDAVRVEFSVRTGETLPFVFARREGVVAARRAADRPRRGGPTPLSLPGMRALLALCVLASDAAWGLGSVPVLAATAAARSGRLAALQPLSARLPTAAARALRHASHAAVLHFEGQWAWDELTCHRLDAEVVDLALALGEPRPSCREMLAEPHPHGALAGAAAALAARADLLPAERLWPVLSAAARALALALVPPEPEPSQPQRQPRSRSQPAKRLVSAWTRLQMLADKARLPVLAAALVAFALALEALPPRAPEETLEVAATEQTAAWRRARTRSSTLATPSGSDAADAFRLLDARHPALLATYLSDFARRFLEPQTPAQAQAVTPTPTHIGSAALPGDAVAEAAQLVLSLTGGPLSAGGSRAAPCEPPAPLGKAAYARGEATFESRRQAAGGEWAAAAPLILASAERDREERAMLASGSEPRDLGFAAHFEVLHAVASAADLVSAQALQQLCFATAALGEYFASEGPGDLLGKAGPGGLLGETGPGDPLSETGPDDAYAEACDALLQHMWRKPWL